MHTCFVGKSFSKLSWDTVQRQGRRTYCGIMVLWLLLSLLVSGLCRVISPAIRSWKCVSAVVVPRYSTRRAEILVSPAIRSWKFLSSRRAEDLSLQRLKELFVSLHSSCRDIGFSSSCEAASISALVVLGIRSFSSCALASERQGSRRAPGAALGVEAMHESSQGEGCGKCRAQNLRWVPEARRCREASNIVSQEITDKLRPFGSVAGPKFTPCATQEAEGIEIRQLDLKDAMVNEIF